ncbi:MAG: DUF2325 domain-containing protein [Spirochaetales bacterium]|jgi:hypothetical protein|nr:DUF2325 domain-containing protein [Spirochaetales bacterium]
MCVAVIGGMDRLQRHYINEAQKFGIDLKVFSKSENGILEKIKNVDALVIFTNKVSHGLKKEVMKKAKANSIPTLMYHSCGVCTLRDCFKTLRKRV